MQRIDDILWDLDDDPNGNVRHIAEHGVSIAEVEEILRAPESLLISRSTGRPIAFGHTTTGKFLAVVYEIVADRPLRVAYPITAYEP